MNDKVNSRLDTNENEKRNVDGFSSNGSLPDQDHHFYCLKNNSNFGTTSNADVDVNYLYKIDKVENTSYFPTSNEFTHLSDTL